MFYQEIFLMDFAPSIESRKYNQICRHSYQKIFNKVLIVFIVNSIHNLYPSFQFIINKP